MTDAERLALGTTYDEAFGAPSGTIHYRAGADPVDHASESTVVTEGTKLGTVSLCVLRRIHELLGAPAVPELDQIARVLGANQEPTRLLEALNLRPAVAMGDFVVARGYLGQAVDERFSQFGYRSVRVELLAERPFPELAADWFRVRDVVRFCSKEKLIAEVRAKVGSPNADIDDLTMRETVLDAWRLRVEGEASRKK